MADNPKAPGDPGVPQIQIDVDESFSNVEAEEVLLAADLSRARRREVVDKLAAAIILRRWLDAQAHGGKRSE